MTVGSISEEKGLNYNRNKLRSNRLRLSVPWSFLVSKKSMKTFSIVSCVERQHYSSRLSGEATGSGLPFLACWARMRRVRGVVPLGMLMMYLPSISAVTRRRFTSGKPVPSSAGWLTTDKQSGGYMRIRQRLKKNKRKKKDRSHCSRGTRKTGLVG